MKLFPLLMIAIGLFQLTACNQAEVVSSSGPSNNEETERLLRHVVLFQFTDSTSIQDIAKIESAFAMLETQIPEVHDLEWGLNNSPESLHKGFTHCFFLTFKSDRDRATYLPHPDHKAFVDLVGPYVKDVLVFDYWNE